jgi:Fur family ferric uptake transcriptional regulator
MSYTKYNTELRTAALQYLKDNADKSITVAQLTDLVNRAGISANPTSIYRYLEALIKEGKVKKYVNHKGQSATYQYTNDDSCNVHLHLQCSSCGQIEHLDCQFMNQFSQHIDKNHNFEIDCKTSILYGLCSVCKKKK